MTEANHLIDTLHGAGRGPFAELPDGTMWDHAWLWNRAARHAGALAGLGVRPRDRVAVQVEKSLEAVALYLGTVMAGGAYVPLNMGYTPAEMAYFLDDAEPRLLVCDPDRVQALGPLAGKATVATLDAQGAGAMAERADAAVPLTWVARDADDLAAILYTSGTTGRSKGAMLSHGNLATNVRVLAVEWGFTAADRLIHALPIFHTHGLFVAINVTLIAGASLIWLPRFDARAVLERLPRATALMGVPTFYTRLLAEEGLTPERCAHIRLFISGSAPLLAETHRAWAARTGHAILERYGMTETGMIASNPLGAARRPGTVGRPLPGVEVAIRDAEGRDLAPGETGMIEVRGPNVFPGYWRMPETTAEAFRPDGWFITGDLGRWDEGGYLELVGRAKDLIISGGYNIYPKEIETEIDALPGVTESAVIGVPHPDFGETPVACVTGRAGLGEADILGPLAPRLARFKQPRRVIVLADLPRNAMGKVEKAVLRARYRDLFTAEPG